MALIVISLLAYIAITRANPKLWFHIGRLTTVSNDDDDVMKIHINAVLVCVFVWTYPANHKSHLFTGQILTYTL